MLGKTLVFQLPPLYCNMFLLNNVTAFLPLYTPDRSAENVKNKRRYILTNQYSANTTYIFVVDIMFLCVVATLRRNKGMNYLCWGKKLQRTKQIPPFFCVHVIFCYRTYEIKNKWKKAATKLKMNENTSVHEIKGIIQKKSFIRILIHFVLHCGWGSWQQNRH